MNLEGLRPIRGPITPGFWEENWIWAVPSILLVAIVALLLGLWLRRHWKQSRIPTALQIFEWETDEIRTLIERGETAEVPSRLSRVLREYIETSTGVRAPEQTTEEFLATAGASTAETEEVSEEGLPEEAFEELRPFLTLTDEAKFARRNLTASECDELLRIAERFAAANENRRNAE